MRLACGLVMLAIFSVILPIQNLYAISYESERQDMIGFPVYTGNRQHIFTDSKIDFCVFSSNNQTISNMAINAVNDWQGNLTKITGNDKVWDMEVHVEPDETTVCDGFINFYKTPNDIIHQIYGVAGYSNPYTQLANVTVYTDFYQETLRNITNEEWEKMTEEKLDEIIKINTHPAFNATSLYRITLHELGHALSLNHPQEAQALGTLSEVEGIMGYNISETKILSNEVKQIVKAYPNGFTDQKSNIAVQLDDYELNNTFYVGEKASLMIEAPYQKNDLPIDSISAYIFPEGKKGSQKYYTAPVQIVREPGKSYILNNGEYFDYIKTIPVNWVNDKYFMTVHFVPKKITSNTNIVVIVKDLVGHSDQWELKKPFSVKPALFSNILLEDKNHNWAWSLAMKNENREIEKQELAKKKMQAEKLENLVKCLERRSMKNCNQSSEEISENILRVD